MSYADFLGILRRRKGLDTNLNHDKRVQKGSEANNVCRLEADLKARYRASQGLPACPPGRPPAPMARQTHWSRLTQRPEKTPRRRSTLSLGRFAGVQFVNAVPCEDVGLRGAGARWGWWGGPRCLAPSPAPRPAQKTPRSAVMSEHEPFVLGLWLCDLRRGVLRLSDGEIQRRWRVVWAGHCLARRERCRAMKRFVLRARVVYLVFHRFDMESGVVCSTMSGQLWRRRDTESGELGEDGVLPFRLEPNERREPCIGRHLASRNKSGST